MREIWKNTRELGSIAYRTDCCSFIHNSTEHCFVLTSLICTVLFVNVILTSCCAQRLVYCMTSNISKIQSVRLVIITPKQCQSNVFLDHAELMRTYSRLLHVSRRDLDKLEHLEMEGPYFRVESRVRNGWFTRAKCLYG